MARSLNNCRHIWGQVQWGEKTVYIPYGSKEVRQGVEHWEEPEGYDTKMVMCQMTKCTKCGEVKYLD